MTPTRRTPARIGRVPTIGIVALLAIVAVGIALVVAAGDDDPTPRPGDLDGDPGVSHVHGLGLNPADGSLIVATHYGSFRLPADGDEAERIGDSFKDTMGFTVVGPDRFLGSGHPDVAGMPVHDPGDVTAIYVSTDDGATWQLRYRDPQ